MRRKDTNVAYWEGIARPSRRVTVKYIDHFSARGMHRVYGRGDNFSGNPRLCMDIWRSAAGRLLVRFWSHGTEVDPVSYEIIGIPTDQHPKLGPPYDESWVPQVLRREYERWIISEI
jgi:hypothetical protein